MILPAPGPNPPWAWPPVCSVNACCAQAAWAGNSNAAMPNSTGIVRFVFMVILLHGLITRPHFQCVLALLLGFLFGRVDDDHPVHAVYVGWSILARFDMDGMLIDD